MNLSFLGAFSVTVILAASLSVSAAPKKSAKKPAPVAQPELSMREQALAESTYVGQDQKRASDAQVESGVLRLQDPMPQALGRSWKYFAAFSAQQFQTEGRASNEFSSFDLGTNDSTWMPGLQIGFVTAAMPTGAVNWHLGARAQGSFASQSVNAVMDSGFIIDDARLNSTLLSVGPLVSLNWSRINWLSLTFVPEVGSLTYTQTTSNDFGKFSKSATYQALSWGLEAQVSKGWSLFTEYTQRELKNQDQLAIQRDNIELGTKILW